MPSATKKNALLRMWELLKQLPQRPPGRTASDLHAELTSRGYPVSKKSVERDLVSLSMVFPITCVEESRPYLWFWAPDSSTGLPGVSLTEAIALTLMEESFGAVMHRSLLEPLKQRLQAARQLIGESSPANPNAGWSGKVIALPRDLTLQPPDISQDVLAVVQDALLADRQVDVDYKSASASRWRRLHPHTLLLRGPVLYLIATEDGTTAGKTAPSPKQYALHRMRSANATRLAVRPGTFDLTRWLKSAQYEVGHLRPIRLKLAARRSLATLLQEAPLAPRQRIRWVDGECIVEAAVRDTQALRRWILGWGPDVTVLAPERLRNAIKGLMKGALDRY